MRSTLLGVALAAGVVLSAASASAAVYTVVYTGEVAPGGYDNTNFFGPGPFAGSLFTLTFKVDTDTLGASFDPTVGPTESKLEGYNAANPVKGVFKIGSKSIAFGDSYGYDLRYDNALDPPCPFPCQAGMEQFARTTFFDNVKGIITDRSIGGTGSAYGYFGQFSGLGHGVPPGDGTHFFGNFSASDRTIDTTGASPVITQKLDIDANLKISGYTIAVVPEPGAWALMILGFGAVGAALRRRTALAA